MTLSSILHANDVIWLVCKLGSKAKVCMQITKTSTNSIEEVLLRNFRKPCPLDESNLTDTGAELDKMTSFIIISNITIC